MNFAAIVPEEDKRAQQELSELVTMSRGGLVLWCLRRGGKFASEVVVEVVVQEFLFLSMKEADIVRAIEG